MPQHLIDRIFHDDADAKRHIANHAFSAAMWFWVRGKLTRADVVRMFDLTTDDQVQLDEMNAAYVALSDNDKLAYHADVEASGILSETGHIEKTDYRALFNLSL